MNNSVPRLRMFAGPNGSGKSTVKPIIVPELLGVYINPDEIEQMVRQQDFLDLTIYGVQTNQQEVLDFFNSSKLLAKAVLLDETQHLRFSDDKIIFHKVSVNAYFASVIADFIRRKLLDMRISYTFETVMSSPDKVELFQQAQAQGYRTYLYYIATEDPAINVSRVKQRVQNGGHPVPEDKIISRYYRSLALLVDAISYSSRAYIFDNSNHHYTWVAEVTEGKTLELKVKQVPKWFEQSVLVKKFC